MIALHHLNFHHLFYFWMVAKEGHLTRAAKQLHISQSALSSQIRKLEVQFGYDLFIREGKKLILTELGTIVLDYAEGIFALGNELISTVDAGEGQKIQQLRVGAVSTLSRNFQENFLRPILVLDNVQLFLESRSLDVLLNHLRIHKLDLVLANQPVSTNHSESWRCRRIAHQPVCLVGPPRKKKNSAFKFPDDLASVKLLLPGTNSDVRNQFDLLCEDLEINAEVFAEVDDMAMLRLLTRDYGGVAVVPEVVVQDELQSGSLEKYCVLPNVYENFYAITTKRHFKKTLLNMLLKNHSAS